MPPHIQSIPRDVLELIAQFSISSSPYDSPTPLLHLLLTCRSIYASLSISSTPQLYANIFLSKFDFDDTRRRQQQLTASCLANELVQRYRLLQRIRRCDISERALVQDLSTALGIILDGGSLNLSQLTNAGIFNFLQTAFIFYAKSTSSSGMMCNGLILWLGAMTCRMHDIKNMNEEQRNDILTLLRPHTLSTFEVTPRGKGVLVGKNYIHKSINGRTSPSIGAEVFYSSRKEVITFPNPSSAAILLTFAFKEVFHLQIPPHLPYNRVEAVAADRSGPTQTDYQTVAAFRTPLLADIILGPPYSGNPSLFPSIDPKMHRDPQFHGLFGTTSQTGLAYDQLLSILPGVWEGTYMVSPFATRDATAAPPDYLCRTPVQCVLDLFLCYSPQTPFATEWMGEDPFNWKVGWEDFHSQRRHSVEGTDHRLNYKQYDSTSKQLSWRTPNDALDCIITGQTEAEHEEAWGGFHFIGKISRDGSIVLKRQPKNSWNSSLGTWVFEGRVCYGSAFVGRWRSSTIDPCVHGIFSMRKACRDE